MSRDPEVKVGLATRAVVAGLLFLLWVALVGRYDSAEWVLGALLAAAVTLMSGPQIAIFSGLRLSLGAPLSFLSWFGYFLLALLKANLDLARRVLSPTLPLNPAFVEVRTGLTSPLGKLALANSITLTPGTLAVDIHDDRLLVHWIDVTPGADLEAATAVIAAGFEKRLAGFLK